MQHFLGPLGGSEIEFLVKKWSKGAKDAFTPLVSELRDIVAQKSLASKKKVPKTTKYREIPHFTKLRDIRGHGSGSTFWGKFSKLFYLLKNVILSV